MLIDFNRKLEKYLKRKLQRRHDDIDWKVEIAEKTSGLNALLLTVSSVNGSFYFGDSKEEVYINFMVSDILKKKGLVATPFNSGAGLPVLNWGSRGAWLLTETQELANIERNLNNLVECSKCEFENSEDEEFCLHCDADLRPIRPLLTGVACKNCETEIPNEAPVCLYCGAHQFSFLKLA